MQPLSCSRDMLRVCCEVIHHLNKKPMRLEDLAAKVRCSQVQCRRALRALKNVGVLEYHGRPSTGEYRWQVAKRMDEGTAAAVVATLFLPDKPGRALLRKVGR